MSPERAPMEGVCLLAIAFKPLNSHAEAGDQGFGLPEVGPSQGEGLRGLRDLQEVQAGGCQAFGEAFPRFIQVDVLQASLK